MICITSSTKENQPQIYGTTTKNKSATSSPSYKEHITNATAMEKKLNTTEVYKLTKYWPRTLQPQAREVMMETNYICEEASSEVDNINAQDAQRLTQEDTERNVNHVSVTLKLSTLTRLLTTVTASNMCPTLYNYISAHARFKFIDIEETAQAPKATAKISKRNA